MAITQFPTLESDLRVRNRYYRTVNLPGVLTVADGSLSTNPVVGRVSFLPDVFYTRVGVMQRGG